MLVWNISTSPSEQAAAPAWSWYDYGAHDHCRAFDDIAHLVDHWWKHDQVIVKFIDSSFWLPVSEWWHRLGKSVNNRMDLHTVNRVSAVPD